MQREERSGEELSAAIDALNRGAKPAATDEEVRELTEVALLLKVANQPPAIADKLAARLAAELTAKRKRRRWWLASSAAGTAVAAMLVIALNLPAGPPPATPLVIPPAGSVVVERLPGDQSGPAPAAPASLEAADTQPSEVAKAAGDKPAADGNRTMLAAKRAGPQTEIAANAAQTAEKTLFATDRFAGWDWYKKTYPKGMAFAVVTAPGQQQNEPAVPAAILARAGDVDYSQQLLVVAYLGTGGGADAIGIESVVVSGREMTVRVRTKSIRPGQVETMNITNPADFVTIDRGLAGKVTQATFIDQQGTVLATVIMIKP
jgi:hypothetical protein